MLSALYTQRLGMARRICQATIGAASVSYNNLCVGVSPRNRRKKISASLRIASLSLGSHPLDGRRGSGVVGNDVGTEPAFGSSDMFPRRSGEVKIHREQPPFLPLGKW